MGRVFCVLIDDTLLAELMIKSEKADADASAIEQDRSHGLGVARKKVSTLSVIDRRAIFSGSQFFSL